MSRSIGTGIINLPKVKVDAILKAIKTLSMRTNHIQDFVAKINNSHQIETS